MNSLPNPNEFIKHTTILSAPKGSKSSSGSYDIQKIDKAFKQARKQCDKKHLDKLGNELICFEFYKTCPNKKAGCKYFQYSKRDDSLTIHLYDNKKELQTIAVRNSNGTKWKTYGSKKFTPYKIEDDVIFLFSGMSEIIIAELLGMSFIGIQSDSMVRHIPQELKELTRDKFIVILSDNDESFKKIIPTIKQFFEHSKVIVIDFEKVLNQELPKGFDFRDFVNQIADANKVLSMLEEEITKGGSND